MDDAVLTINAGSSSLKFSLFTAGASGASRHSADGEVSGIGTAPKVTGDDAQDHWPTDPHADHEAFLDAILRWAARHGNLTAVGHRIVHGGTFDGPQRVDDGLMAELRRLTPLAPLHQPHNLAPIDAIAAARPKLPQVACFDTSFHRTLPRVAARYALPRDVVGEDVRRYGFHGLSYEYIAGRLKQLSPRLAAGRVVVAHLGNGASLCALKAGRSIDTTMGFTALDGLVMGTRPGALDPGILLYLLQEKHLSAAEIEDLLYQRSGLLGVSGSDSDMRALLKNQANRAQEAVELFVYQIVRQTGALTSVLGGLDGIVFTGGIGEHSPEIRSRVATGLAWIGLSLDEPANRAGDGRISTTDSRVEAWAIKTDEEAMIARHTIDILRRDPDMVNS